MGVGVRDPLGFRRIFNQNLLDIFCCTFFLFQILDSIPCYNGQNWLSDSLFGCLTQIQEREKKTKTSNSSHPDSEGHIAIILPSRWLYEQTKQNLLTKEQYEATR